MSTHLQQLNMSYVLHMKRSMYFSWILLKGSFFAFVHACAPQYFQDSTTDTLNHLKSLLKSNDSKNTQTSNARKYLTSWLRS